MQGWIKVHRKLLSSEVFRNEKLLKVFMYCLLKATHSDHDFVVGKQVVSLNPGQFVFGRKKAAQELEMHESTVRDYINLLKKQKIIDIKSTNKYSVITVVNWGFYQSDNENSDSKNDNRMTAKSQQNDTYKNVKNEKNEKKKDIRPKQVYDEDSIPFKLASYLHQQIKKNLPDHKEPNLQKWSDEMRKIVALDKRDHIQVAQVIKWAQANDFWWSYIMSPTNLRKKYDTLLAQMKKDSQPPVRKKTEQEIRAEKEHQQRKREIALNQWISDGNDPATFVWSED